MAFLSSIFWLSVFSTVDAIPVRNSEGHRCLIPGSIRGQAEQGLEQVDLVEDVPVYCWEVGLDDL